MGTYTELHLNLKLRKNMLSIISNVEVNIDYPEYEDILIVTNEMIRSYIKELKDEKYKYKKQLLTLLEITDNQITLIEQERFWFTKWTEFDFGLELQAKRSQEVY